MLRSVLDGLAAPERLETALVLVSELVTNAVRHGDEGVHLAVTVDPDVIVVEVDDAAPDEPRLRQAGTGDTSGRGLVIVDALARRWGHRGRRGGGKTVWFELPLAGERRER